MGQGTCSSGLCGCAHWVAGSITEWWTASHVLVDSSWGRTCRSIFPRGRAPAQPSSYHGLEPDLGAFAPTTGDQTVPWQGCNNHRAKRRPHPTSVAGSGYHNNNHTFYQGDNTLQTLRKDVAGIHTKNSPHTKIWALRHLGSLAWKREMSPGKGSALTLNTDGLEALGSSELARPGWQRDHCPCEIRPSTSRPHLLRANRTLSETARVTCISASG